MDTELLVVKIKKGGDVLDLKHFFEDVEKWIVKCNQVAQKHGIESEYFWHWSATTLARLTEKYDNHDFAKAQAMMLWEWVVNKYEKKVS